jgi:regulator of RNase E activity RraB
MSLSEIMVAAVKLNAEVDKLKRLQDDKNTHQIAIQDINVQIAAQQPVVDQAKAELKALL